MVVPKMQLNSMLLFLLLFVINPVNYYRNFYYKFVIKSLHYFTSIIQIFNPIIG